MPDRSIEHRTKVPEIRKGDMVVVLAGKDAGKRGKVDQVIRRDPSPSPVRSGYRRTSLKGGVLVVVAGSTSPASTPSRASDRRAVPARCPRSIRAASSIARCRSRSAG